MHIYKTQNGKKVKNVKFEKTWYVIPVKSDKGSAALNTETYLIQPRVAEYIEKLEAKIKGDLPKLSKNNLKLTQ